MNPFDERRAASIRGALARWYDAHKRDLPWRAAPSLYGTVVSEFMLQQTQVATVIPYYERWMKRFGSFEALALAAGEEVLKHWEGLGYYSRARNLHRLARQWTDAPRKPETADEWRAYPGVGPYAAAAISSIAQGRPEAVVDGNVVRVLTRLAGEERVFGNAAAATKAVTAAAAALLDRERPGDHNQAMMELGATLCVKQRPRCTECPLEHHCAAARAGTAADIPRIRRKATEQREVERLVVLDDRAILLSRIPADARRLAGQYELPLRSRIKGRLPQARSVVRKVRGITHYRVTETLIEVPASDGIRRRVAAADDLEWIGPERLAQVTLSGPHRRWVEEILKRR